MSVGCADSSHLTAAAVIVFVSALLAGGCGRSPEVRFDGPTGAWPAYGGDGGGARYTPATQIDRGNVSDLEVAWTFNTGHIDRSERNMTFQATPILAAGSLVFCTPLNRVVALDPETGGMRWSFDPGTDPTIAYANNFTCRGVSQWRDTATDATSCSERIFTATNDGRLIALDAASGDPCSGFGAGGEVDLKLGVGELQWPGEYQVTSPPAVFRDLVITGSAVNDNGRLDAPSGVVRAYDARDGSLVWAWDPIPEDLEQPPPAVSEADGAWRHGTPNVWSVISVDEELGLVYLPTGNTSPDFYGGQRTGSDVYSSSVVALDGATGEVAWSFQTVHHDIWDMDVPAQPTLMTIRRGAESVPALVQATKMGLLFFLDRRTGESLFPIEERPVPPSDVPGETAWPTQPFPSQPPPLARHHLDPSEPFGLFGLDTSACRERLAALRYDGIYTPPSVRGSLILPGNAGGSNWGGVAVDPKRGVVFANTMNLAWSVRLVPRERFASDQGGSPDAERAPQLGTPYGLVREIVFSPLSIPCTPPPWGELAAVDAASGEILWQVPIGSLRDILAVPIPISRWGTPTLGGPVATAGGLVFIGGTFDNNLRALDADTGELLWTGRLPAAPIATPMTYRLSRDSRQFVVIAAGGYPRLGLGRGDALVAFALR